MFIRGHFSGADETRLTEAAVHPLPRLSTRAIDAQSNVTNGIRHRGYFAPLRYKLSTFSILLDVDSSHFLNEDESPTAIVVVSGCNLVGR